MPSASFGTTHFDFPESWEPGAKIKISTAEGSVVAVPAEDVLRFVFGCYIIPQRQVKAGNQDWREGILGP